MRPTLASYGLQVPVLASIPSPSQSVWHLGPLPIRAYALCIVVGIFAAVALTLRRWRERGGVDEDAGDVSGRALRFGLADGGQACAGSSSVHGLFQPTFLYESLWDIALAVALIVIDRRLRLGRGTVFALYAMGYTAGRAWIEALRHDPSHHFLGV